MAQGQRVARKEAADLAAVRWEKLRALQALYADVIDFADRCMEMLGFSLFPIQEDILRFLADESRQTCMVQAQRGQAKSTLAAILILWDLIQNPHHRNAIVMPQEGLAMDLVHIVKQLLTTLPELECLLPDRQAGDRWSALRIDIHHSLKGLDKSPSLAPISVEAILQGRRTDLTLLDDIESAAKGLTAEGRGKLLAKAMDFYAICQYRLIWLGTPQSLDSLYFQLPAKDVEVRVWPGRFPTPAERGFYGDTLAPWIIERMEANPALQTGGGLDGTRGQVTCPELRSADEQAHQKLELKGKEWYELQYMLNATLSDAGRKALKPSDVVVVPHSDTFPVSLVVGNGPGYTHKHTSAGHRFEMALPLEVHSSRKAPVIKAYVDPAAGGNTSKDRTAFAVVGLVGGNLILLSYGSVEGGYDEPIMRKLARYLAPHKPSLVMIEKNMGFGAFKQVFQPILLEEAMKLGWSPGIEEELVKGQKELRIIDTLSPILGRKSLWVTDRALNEEPMYMDGVRGTDAVSYSLWHQMANVTRTKGCLRHDDNQSVVIKV